MTGSALLHPDRLLPVESKALRVARRLYHCVKDLPIVSPHGHTDANWFANNQAFSDPAELLIKPDHYLLRMLYSQGVDLSQLGLLDKTIDRKQAPSSRQVWQIFANHYHCFQGTPSRLWFDHALQDVFAIKQRLTPDNADSLYDQINECLARPEFLPKALFERFNIEVLATTESPLDDLASHALLSNQDWSGRVITTYRPDPVVDPEHPSFSDNIKRFGQLCDTDTSTWLGYLQAHKLRRQFFIQHGATATDHGHPSAVTADLTLKQCENLYSLALQGRLSRQQSELFRGQMLTEMAAMSLQDGMVLQIHPGVLRNHNNSLFTRFGADKGADIPQPTDYVTALQPLLNKYGNQAELTIIVFTLDEAAYSRELAPLAGHYPCLTLGPPWWFLDSVEGMLRYKKSVLETAGFYNTAGFNDDTRAFLSIPARHDVARRVDCRHLAELVCEHRLDEDEAVTLAENLAYHFAKKAYKL